MIIHDYPQQSEQWFNARKGRATASQFSKIFTPTGRLSKSAIGYMRKLARECVLDDSLEYLGDKYTEWGNEQEPHARAAFALATGFDVREVGFVTRADNAPLGCSPDGLIYEDDKPVAGLEIKCQSVDVHVEQVLDGVLPAKHKLQVHGSMAVTGLNKWWFYAWFPGLNPLCICVERDDFTEQVTDALNQFIIDYADVRHKVLTAILPQTKGTKGTK